MEARRRDLRKFLAAMFLACPWLPLQAQSLRFGGELALSSQLVDQGLAITPATPILQASMAWTSPGGWSLGVAGGVELRAPGQPVLVLGRASRAWALSEDWMGQASLLYYDYRARRGVAIPDRVDANLYFTYRDLLSIGVTAMRPVDGPRQQLLGAADIELNYPLSRHLSLAAGAGIAQASIRAYGPHAYGAGYQGRYAVEAYGFGSLGLAWTSGRLRLQLDRNLNSLGDRRAYGSEGPRDWVATASWRF